MTTSSRIQIRGNCQCCGRDQAVVRGDMSKHGYTVTNGWFNGVCSGHHYAPLQISRIQADQTVESVKFSVARLQEKLVAVEAGTETPEKIDLVNGKVLSIPFKAGTAEQQKKAVFILKHGLMHRIQAGNDFANNLEQMANRYHGKPLSEVKLDEAQIVAGSVVKVSGSVVTVTKIEYRVAHGVGPSINGQHILHVCFERNGKELAYPKRFAKLA